LLADRRGTTMGATTEEAGMTAEGTAEGTAVGTAVGAAAGTADEAAVDEFAELFRRFLERMAAPRREGLSLAERVEQHLGVDPIGLSAIAESFELWHHANVQAALDAYLAQPGHRAELIGVIGPQKRSFGGSLSDLLGTRAVSVAGVPASGARSGPVDFVNVAAGAGRTMTCIQFGIMLVDGADGRLAVLVRGADERTGPPGSGKVTVEVMGPEPDRVASFLTRLRALVVEHNVFRGQMVSLARRQPPYGGITVQFHARPEVRRDDIVLADGVLDRIEGHVVGIGAERDRLVAAGRHLKRGLLLHGPPGTGKTLTVRYLTSRMADATVLVLSGPALGLVGPTCALARTLTPAVVVLEDVDLVAEERTMPGTGRNALLFELLNEMEGMAEDADVAFLLTSNRPDLLEPALARPGRVDLAVEIDLPGAAARRRLFELYGRGLNLRLEDPDAVTERTEGVSPAFIKELLRKASLMAARETADGELVVTDVHVNAALDELLSETAVLTRLLLGGATDRPPPTTRASMEWLPGASSPGDVAGFRRVR
jgi:hypothetical protein